MGTVNKSEKNFIWKTRREEYWEWGRCQWDNIKVDFNKTGVRCFEGFNWLRT
jgi:hypothetical protein